jgi:hypothetical protein
LFPIDQRALDILKIKAGASIQMRLIAGVKAMPQQSSAISAAGA